MDENRKSRILVADDDPDVRGLICAMLSHAGYLTIDAVNAKTAIILLAKQECDVVISDIKMPGMSGIDLLKTIHRNSPDIPVILITGFPDLSTATEAVRMHSAVDYLIKPVSGQDLLQAVKRAAELKRVRDENKELSEKNRQYRLHLEDMVEAKNQELTASYRELQASYDFSLEAMVAMLDAREQATGKHSIRVRDLVLAAAMEMKLPQEELDHIARGTLLHDIGKIGIPDSILLKQSQLTDEEWTIMRTHVQIGYDIVKASSYLAPAAEIVLAHHERFDGSGYPRGLKGRDICLGARIFAIIDAYDAMRSVRVYQGSVSEQQAVKEILRCSGTHFDPEIVNIFRHVQPQLEKIGNWNELT